MSSLSLFHTGFEHPLTQSKLSIMSPECFAFLAKHAILITPLVIAVS